MTMEVQSPGGNRANLPPLGDDRVGCHAVKDCLEFGELCQRVGEVDFDTFHNGEEMYIGRGQLGL